MAGTADADRRAGRMMRGTRSGMPTDYGGSGLVETVIGIVLIVIAALEIWFIVRTVQANMRGA